MMRSTAGFDRRKLLCLTMAGIVLNVRRARAAGPLTIFAAASLKEALDEVAAAFMVSAGIAMRISYAASSQLARQIAAGAPADFFISADNEWMDWLEKDNHIEPASRRVLLGNTLVLVAEAAISTGNVALDDRLDLAALIGDRRLAMAEPDSVPAGRYARQALQHLRLWGGVEKKLVFTTNVRAALALAARGEAGFAIVYASDAVVELRVRVVARFSADSHQPILYPIAKTMQARPEADAFLTYTGRSEVKALFERHGFRYLLDSRA